MLEIGALWALWALAGKCAFWRPSGWKRAGLEAAPGVGENFVGKSPDT